MNAAGATICLVFALPVGDLERFPNIDAARAKIELLDKELSILKAKQSIDLAYRDDWQKRIDRVADVRRAWWLLGKACWDNPNFERSEWLWKLSEVIGREAYMAGKMPELEKDP